MVDFEYLSQGLRGMARAHLANAMTGHLGAAVVAGYFFGEDHHGLNEAVHVGVEGELNRILEGEEEWFDPDKAGITVQQLFEEFPVESPDPEQISTIATALSANIDKTRQSGHNVIFASIAIRALYDHSALATPSVVGGIRKLIEGFNGAGPGRGYYGQHRGWIQGADVSLPADDDFPPYQDEVAMANAAIDELINTASERRQGFGSLWHIINHAAAITELSRFGFEDLARQGLAAHHYHVRLWRSLPDVEDELGAVPRAEHDPLRPEYWASGTLKRDSARLTHRIKTLYGFYALARLIEDDDKRKMAEDKLRYLM